jgi:hypothetical protein
MEPSARGTWRALSYVERINDERLPGARTHARTEMTWCVWLTSDRPYERLNRTTERLRSSYRIHEPRDLMGRRRPFQRKLTLNAHGADVKHNFNFIIYLTK